MSIQSIVEQVIDALNDLSVPYMLRGSLATNLYVISRSTADADFVVQLDKHAATDLARRLGPDFKLDPQMSFETNTATSRFVFIHDIEEFSIEFFLLSNDPHDQERSRRRRQHRAWSRDIHAATAEDIIVMKVRWLTMSRRIKDREDAVAVVRAVGDRKSTRLNSSH